jgi:hypothetical protein
LRELSADPALGLHPLRPLAGKDRSIGRERGVLIYAYANNHFGGHTPATIARFEICGAARDCRKRRSHNESAKSFHCFQNDIVSRRISSLPTKKATFVEAMDRSGE